MDRWSVALKWARKFLKRIGRWRWIDWPMIGTMGLREELEGGYRISLYAHNAVQCGALMNLSRWESVEGSQLIGLVSKTLKRSGDNGGCAV